MAGHAGNGACIRFVDECEFKVSVLGQRRLEKKSLARICFGARD